MHVVFRLFLVNIFNKIKTLSTNKLTGSQHSSLFWLLKVNEQGGATDVEEQRDPLFLIH